MKRALLRLIFLASIGVPTAAYAQHAPAEKPVRICTPSRVSGANAPLYIVDGKALSSRKIAKIEPSRIDSIHVYKDDEAMRLFGPKGRNGAIALYLKETKPTSTAPAKARTR
ncbi:MAG: hypothetical protein EAZ91_05525 [Cytophagales bacterium]|nr:MAG: hypothetical protein EAZ91_05525 [Cytophagales bacterium]